MAPAYGYFSTMPIAAVLILAKSRPDYFSFGAVGGELNYYYFSGPEPKKIIQNYTAMVGHAPLPAVDAGFSAKPLQLLSGGTRPRDWRANYPQRKFRWMPFTSTLTTSREMLPLP